MWTIALSLAIGYGLGLGLVEVFDLFENEDDTETAEPVATEADTDMLDDINIVEPTVAPAEAVTEDPSDAPAESTAETQTEAEAPSEDVAAVEDVAAAEETTTPLIQKQPLDVDQAEPLSPDTISNGDFDVETDVLLVEPIAGGSTETTAQLIEDAESQTTDLVLSNAETKNATMTIYATGLTWDNVSFRDWNTAPDMLTPITRTV